MPLASLWSLVMITDDTLSKIISLDATRDIVFECTEGYRVTMPESERQWSSPILVVVFFQETLKMLCKEKTICRPYIGRGKIDGKAWEKACSSMKGNKIRYTSGRRNVMEV